VEITETETHVNGIRRRVLFMIPTLTGGGAERVIVTILRHLDRNRFLPILAVVDTRNARFIEDVPEDVQFIDLHCARVRYALPKILRLMWKQRPDVVLSTLGHLNLALAILRPLLPNGVRYVARETIVLSAHLEMKSWAWLWRMAYRRFYGRLDLVICQSQDMQKDLVQQFNLPPTKTIVIHNPVDLTRIRQLSSAPLEPDHRQRNGRGNCNSLRLVSAGRLTYQKGFDLLIDAVALSARPAIELTILGEGPLRQELEQRALVRGVAQQVKFLGFQKNPYPYLADAHAFVLSSRFEGFPNVVLEALSCGTPVIALPAPGGVREILEGLSGCIVTESISAESLGEAIRDFSSGRVIDHHIVEQYAVEPITRRYEQQFMLEGAP
jgi:glycosyltransferase involved in cell wall biosynthesis